MPYCPYCGSEVSDEDRFCQSCGAMLDGTGPSPVPTRRPGNGPKVVAIDVVSLVLIACVFGAILMPIIDLATGDVKTTYTWEYGGHSFSYKLSVDRSYYNMMIDSDIDRTGSLSTDRYTTATETVPAVSEYIVVDKYITDLSAALKEKYKEAFGADPGSDDYVRFVAAFVQICIEYDYDEYNGDYEYWRYPLETLCSGKGDCEDTSILMAALIDAGGYNAGIILITGHAMCAIANSDLTGTYENLRTNGTKPYEGLQFYPIESTTSTFADIGQIDEQSAAHYMHLYMGHATEYY